MSSAHRFTSGRSIGYEFTIKIATSLLCISALTIIACCLFSTAACAQGSLSLGTIQVANDPVPCPAAGSGWYYYKGGSGNTYMNCFGATVICPNTANLGATFGYMNPVGIVPGISQALGVIVIHGSDGGTKPGDFGFADSYFSAGYEIVELAWADDWEQTYDPFVMGDMPSIQNAACRPATFLNYVYASIFPSISHSNPNAGMCAQGDSGGSAAIAYSLAYYGSGTYLDNVELLNGPVLSDIKQGCHWPSAGPTVTVCGLTNYQGGQYGCQLGGGSTWTLSPTYVLGSNLGVGKWTNNSSCADANGTTTMTTPQSESAWLAQSIVDQSTGGSGQGAIPTFTYSNTAMSGWLCRSVKNNGSTNNSSPQGQIFYANIGASNSPPNYAVYAVDTCGNAEGVGSGNVPGYHPAIFHGTITGANAITYDMIGLAPNIPPQCIRRSH